jgi:hypothetical protein
MHGEPLGRTGGDPIALRCESTEGELKMGSMRAGELDIWTEQVGEGPDVC